MTTRRVLLIACAVVRTASVCLTCSDVAQSTTDFGTEALGFSCPGPAESTCCVAPCPEGMFCIQARDELPCPSSVPEGATPCSIPDNWNGEFECLYDPVMCGEECSWTTKATCKKGAASDDYTWDVMIDLVICPEEECPRTQFDAFDAVGTACASEGLECKYSPHTDECTTEPFYTQRLTCTNGVWDPMLIMDPIPCYCPEEFPTGGVECVQLDKQCKYGQDGCEAICDRDTGTWVVTEQTGCDDAELVQPAMCYSCNYMAEQGVAASCSADQVDDDCCSPCGPDSEVCLAAGEVGTCPLTKPGHKEACSERGLVCMYDATQCASIFFDDQCGFATKATCTRKGWKVKANPPCREAGCEDPKYTKANGKKKSCARKKHKCHKPRWQSLCPNTCKPECELYDGGRVAARKK